jgi:hypothetical protein
MRRSLTYLMIMGLIAGSGATAEAAPRRHERLVPAHSRTANHAAARSGTIVTGVATGLAGGQPLGCEMTPDCGAWLASGCDPALTGRNPAIVASIEDVADLAHRPTGWIFEHDPGAAAHATVQLWRQDCTEIGSGRSGSGGCYGCFSLWIPRSAKWMTVTGYTYNPWNVWLPVPDPLPVTFDWTLSALLPGS